MFTSSAGGFFLSLPEADAVVDGTGLGSAPFGTPAERGGMGSSIARGSGTSSNTNGRGSSEGVGWEIVGEGGRGRRTASASRSRLDLGTKPDAVKGYCRSRDVGALDRTTIGGSMTNGVIVVTSAGADFGTTRSTSAIVRADLDS